MALEFNQALKSPRQRGRLRFPEPRCHAFSKRIMCTDPLDWLPFLLQTSDPLFPTGAYAHSLGLEETVRLGVVRDEEGLLDYLKHQTLPAMERLELPFLRFAFDAARASDIETLCGIDRELGTVKICNELRMASAQLGVRRLQILLKTFPCDLLQHFDAKRLRGEAAGHHLVVYALQMASAAVPLDAALAAWLYQSLAGACGAALKLIRIGQEGCQRVLKECLAAAHETIAASMTVRRGEAGWFNPMLEIAAMRHEYANERLFIS